MRFKVVEIEDMKYIVKWRNKQLPMLRTGQPLTFEMQEKFYHEVLCQRHNSTRLFSVVDNLDNLIGMAGFENIQWENSLAEISLLTDPGKTLYIKPILEGLINMAYNTLNLKTIFTEVYDCSPYAKLWYEMASEKKALLTKLPLRKYWEGSFYNSSVYTFTRLEVCTYEDIIPEPSSTLN